jgi:hypothetical protein
MAKVKVCGGSGFNSTSIESCGYGELALFDQAREKYGKGNKEYGGYG